MPTAKKTAKSVVSPPPAGAKDTVAKNRTVAFATADQFPRLPAGYQATRVEERRRRLRPIPQSLVAEGLRALRELSGLGEELAKDFGEFAPDISTAPALAARIEALEAAVVTQQALLDAYREIEDIALTDAVEILESVHEEYDHRVKKVPSLATKYSMLAAFFQARSDAISKGMARSRDEGAAAGSPS